MPTLKEDIENLKEVFGDKELTFAARAGFRVQVTPELLALLRRTISRLEKQFERSSKAGQAARGRSGRPRIPDDELTPQGRWARKRRAAAKAD